MASPCLFFDRDGVVNLPPTTAHGYLCDWAEFQFTPGIIDVLAKAKRLGFATVLITNQQGVAKGILAESQLTELHRQMQQHLRTNLAEFDAIHAAIGFAGNDRRRKPQPTMLLEAETNLQLDLKRSWMIGDHDNDMLAGQAAGVGSIRFVGEKAIHVPSDHLVQDADALLCLLDTLNHLEP